MKNRKSLSRKDVKNILKHLKQVLTILLKFPELSVAPLIGKYGEFFAVNKLWKYGPKLGNFRKDKSADIYLEKNGKRVEVKTGVYKKLPNGAYGWGWGFGNGNQIKKFDFAILIALDKKYIKPKHIFILTQEEMLKLNVRKGGIPTEKETYYLNFYDNFPEAKKSEHYYSDILETDLNLHKEKYENAWHKIC
jgi:hypothetical protein